MSRRNSTARWDKALDLWQAPPEAGEPLVCLATSFTFDATFFETECVGRFLQMDTHPSESDSVAYLIEREEKLAAAKVCALIDRRYARDKESLRWDVVGVLIPRGIQHSKVALLAWRNHVRVIVGSGNLTEPGYRKNLEVFGAIDLSREEGGDRKAVQETLRFLGAVAAFGVGEDGSQTPKGRATEALAAVRRLISRWPHDPPRHAPSLLFAEHNKSVLAQIAATWSNQSPPRTAAILSPFFDPPGGSKRPIEALSNVIAKRGEREVIFSVRAEALPNARVRVYAPLNLINAAKDLGEVTVWAVSSIQKGEVRPLHAKMLYFDNDRMSQLLIGSSNFTTAGVAGGGNLEANLLYRINASDPDATAIEDLWPEDGDEIDIGSPNLDWDPEPEEMEGAGDTIPLPGAFRDAIYSADDPPSLAIHLGPSLPPAWRIQTSDGIEVLSSITYDGADVHRVIWTDRPVPFVLVVSWRSESGDALANWPVNVANPATLAPPEALKGLDLEELLEILASTRPLPAAVAQVLAKRAQSRGSQDEVLDPLKRFDSEAFLLRRTKRVAAALDRLRQRLERPVLTREAFEWRLNGPIGPRALAAALNRDARIEGEARFYLAELALTLRRVDARESAKGGLRLGEVQPLLDAAIAELQVRAESLPTSETPQLNTYVAAAFREALS